MHEKSFELQKLSNIQVHFCILFKPSINMNRGVLQKKIHILSCMLNILVDMLNLSIPPHSTREICYKLQQYSQFSNQ